MKKAIEIYSYKDYQIRIYKAPLYNFKSVDNKSYDKIIMIEDKSFTDDCSQGFEIEIEKYKEVQTVLVMATYLTPAKFSAFHENGLFMIFNNDILCIFNLETLTIEKQVKIKSMGDIFAVYGFEEDYILYGEFIIYRIAKDLSVKWEFSGRDIFVRYDGNEPAFIMKKDRICLYDFEDNYYELDNNGKLILDKPRIPVS